MNTQNYELRTFTDIFKAALVCLVVAGAAFARPAADPPPPTLSVRVVDQSGAQIPGARVLVSIAGATSAVLTTGQDGRVLLPARPEEMLLAISADAYIFPE